MNPSLAHSHDRTESPTFQVAGSTDARFPRPNIYHYCLKSLRSLPRRLLSPPAVPSEKVQFALSVRTFRLTPAFNIKLEDMLVGKHVSPLALPDFEEWLLFTEHSAENLYFLQWLNSYADPKQRVRATPAQLAISLARCKETFFTPNAPLELNLPGDITRAVLENIHIAPLGREHSLQSPPPDMASFNTPCSPHLFDATKQAVEELLSASLTRFISQSTGNAGWPRRFFGCSGGIICIAMGLIPVIVSVMKGHSRWIRISAYPLFWLGALHLLTGSCRMCWIIFLFGDARQLHGYELARLSPTPLLATSFDGPSTHPPQSPTSTTSPGEYAYESDKDKIYDIESQMQPRPVGTPIPSTEPADERHPYYSTNSASNQEKKNNDQYCIEISDRVPTDSTLQTTIPQAIPGLEPASFDFDALPMRGPTQRKRSLLPNSSRASLPPPIWGPLTKVLSPIVKRSHWEIFVKAAAWSTIIAATLGTVCLALPFKNGRGHGSNW